MAKYVYTFGGGAAEGAASDKNLLGGKGANLAEMCSLGIPVPAGFTVSTECCTAYYAGGCRLPDELTDQVLAALKKTETIMGMKYGDAVNPLIVSCRSGARSSMPGMMDTVLNVGLSTTTIPGMIARTVRILATLRPAGDLSVSGLQRHPQRVCPCEMQRLRPYPEGHT